MGQNETEIKSLYDNLPPRHQLFVDFKAVEGLMLEPGGIKQVSMDDFAKKIGVVRATLYRWRDGDIDRFWELVEYRRPLLLQQRIGVIYKGLMLRAAKGDAKQAEIMLNQLDHLKARVEKSEVTHIIPQPILGGKAEEPNGV